MPQELRVVQCYKCSIFQVDIVKKVNKWQCKLCGEKQTLRQEFGRGTGKECRLHVQKLNDRQRENDSIAVEFVDNVVTGNAELPKHLLNEVSPDDDRIDLKGNIVKPTDELNKWNTFVEEEVDDDEDETTSFDKIIIESNNTVSREQSQNSFSKKRTYSANSTKLTNTYTTSEYEYNNQKRKYTSSGFNFSNKPTVLPALQDFHRKDQPKTSSNGNTMKGFFNFNKKKLEIIKSNDQSQNINNVDINKITRTSVVESEIASTNVIKEKTPSKSSVRQPEHTKPTSNSKWAAYIEETDDKEDDEGQENFDYISQSKLLEELRNGEHLDLDDILSI